MLQAAVNLREQWVHLVILVMAILQPLIVLLLIFGLILATAHLLTMLGTRWGDRKASSKSLIFSIGIHVLLGGAIVALIPEYRAKIYAELAIVDSTQVDIQDPLDQAEIDAPHFKSGNIPIWEKMPDSVPPEQSRLEMQPVQMTEPVPVQPMLQSEFTPAPSEDRAELPPESRPVPQQELAADVGRTEEATTQMQVDAVQRDLRQEVEPSPAERQRANLVNPAQDDPTALLRPIMGSVDRLTPTPVTEVDPRSLTQVPSPMATIRRADPAEENVRREGPAPADASTELVGRANRSEDLTSSATGVPEPRMTRTPLGANLSEEMSSRPEVYRPMVKPTLPTVTDRTPEASVSSLNQFSPQNMAQPQLARTDDSALPLPAATQVPATYTLRTEEKRQLAILQYGGSEESEAAVDRALAWLASTQEPEGYWSASKYGSGKVKVDDNGIDRENAGLKSDTGVTALAVLAFMGKLNTPKEGKYSGNVNRALHWLVAQQKEIDWFDLRGAGYSSGYLGGEGGTFEGMYCHAMATFALGEALAMSKDDPEMQWIRPPLEKAVQLILELQIADGSWRYVKGQPYGDMSMFGWQFMALKSAEAAGIPIPSETKLKMARFLQASQQGRFGGLSAYHPNSDLYRNSPDQERVPSPTMTAEALFCRQMMGMATNEKMTEESVEYLLKNPPRRTNLNYYYWYYGTLSMYQRGGKTWDQWNLSVRDLLISEQRTSGEFAGSWDPRDVWGPYGGRIYSTAVATLTLEVYYRYLPLYRLNEK